MTTDSEPIVDTQQTQCCIVGGGPAGIVLALLLARQGVQVTLLEAQHDFDRDFRGDTIVHSQKSGWYRQRERQHNKACAQNSGSDLARSLGCKFDVDGMAHSDNKKTTCIPGLFLAGDVDGDVQFVIVAAGEGAAAAVAINLELQHENGWA